MVNKWKVFTLTVITLISFQVLAQLYTYAIPRHTVLDTTPTVWAWSSLIMGIYMAYKFKSFKEFFYGLGMWLICLFPFGFILGLAYFAHCYYKQEESKIISNEEIICAERTETDTFVVNSPANNTKSIWAIVFCAMVLLSICYVPYHIVRPNGGEIPLGYGWVFTHKINGALPIHRTPLSSAKPKKALDELLKDKQWEDNIQRMMVIDYSKILLEIGGSAAICAIGYTLTTVLKKTDKVEHA